MSPPVYTAQEMLAEVRREIRKRQGVYPRLVDRGTMTREQAARQIDIMRAVADLLSKEEAKERLI